MLAGINQPTVLLLCGGGNNGGDALAVARHLHNQVGIAVTLFLTAAPDKYSGDALTNWRIAEAMHLPRLEAFDEVMRRHYDLIIDGMFGTGLTEAPRRPAASYIHVLNGTTNVLSIDLPSGMNCDTGEPMGACIRAARTVTFVAEKAGFANPASRQYTGEVTVGDIGCPRELIDQVAAITTHQPPPP